MAERRTTLIVPQDQGRSARRDGTNDGRAIDCARSAERLLEHREHRQVSVERDPFEAADADDFVGF